MFSLTTSTGLLYGTLTELLRYEKVGRAKRVLRYINPDLDSVLFFSLILSVDFFDPLAPESRNDIFNACIMSMTNEKEHRQV